MRYLILVVAGFCLFCGWLVIDSGLFETRSQSESPCILLQAVAGDVRPETTIAPAQQQEPAEPTETYTLGADNAPARTISLGSVDPKSGFKYRLEFSSKGAAIREATFSEYYDKDPKKPQPLKIISPALLSDGSEVSAMANTNFVFDRQKMQLPLDKLHWKSTEPETEADGTRIVHFEAIIKRQDTGEPIMKLTKTYKVHLDSYLLDCEINVENLSDTEQKINFNMTGPGGLDREGSRSDLRKVVAGFRDSKGQIAGVRLDKNALNKAKSVNDRRPDKSGADFLWLAAVNMYFAAIVVPVPEEGKDYCDWIADKTGQLYNPDRDSKADSGDETLGTNIKTVSSTLAAARGADDSRTYSFQIYIGPKDKSFFDKNEMYRNLGFVQTIDFMACCCPAGIINPLAFGILALMKWMHGFWPHNYGIVIIILVFLMRLVMHPVTKKSQVSMSKMSKLAPRAEEIKKKYANNKAEMNKQMMALYREQGASPIMGMLPMIVQMPIWIALYSAVYSSIELRGAAFLPFWITDLSAPDALFRFPAFTLPLFGKLDSFNLLPILMGVAFYLQQQLMPSQAGASTNPQMAQQQKMMKIMLPLMFPLMLYKGPSGVNLYIMASTFAGVIESHVIRKHIKEKEEEESQGLVATTSKAGGKVKKKKPKPFFKT